MLLMLPVTESEASGAYVPNSGSIGTAELGFDEEVGFLSVFATGGTSDGSGGVLLATDSTAGFVADGKAGSVSTVAVGGEFLAVESGFGADLGGVVGPQPKDKVSTDAQQAAKISFTTRSFAEQILGELNTSLAFSMKWIQHKCSQHIRELLELC